MARIFFRLRLVPDDEAEDVRQLLDDSHIPWYETSAGRWGVSFPAIWVTEDDDLPRAKELLAQYQANRLERIRAEQQSRAENGESETLISRILQRPVQGFGILIVIAVIVYFSIRPFFSILES